MKRGKEEEKVVGPMFPRLHVNDTEKGGPRAPPRNKMALYEQLSVPSNRFNQTRLLPLNPSAPPPPSSRQGTGLERSYVFPVHSSSQAPTRRKSYSSYQYDGGSSNSSLVQPEQRKKVDEDDFTVPVYVHSRNGQSNDRTLETIKGRSLTPVGSMNCDYSVAVENDSEKDPKQFGSPLFDIRKDVSRESEGCPKVSSSKEQQVRSVKNISSGETMDSIARQAKLIRNQEYQDYSVSNIGRLHQADAHLRQECVASSQSNADECDDGLLEFIRDTDNGNTLVPGRLISRENQTSTQEVNSDAECHDTRTSGLLQEANLDESDNASKISTVENLSSTKVSPDDVVGMLGQKHFWKARREIVNQQRIFAVQVFELHRLIKVQQLIAGSPDLVLEDAAFIGKVPVKGSSSKNLSLEVVVEPMQRNLKKRKDDSLKPSHKMECSAENAVVKTPLLSQRSGSHLSNYTPFPGNPHQTSVTANNRIGPLCFNPSPGHQWLVPVMSPSEGLVYKPYPGPGFTGSMCGGFGPFGPVPLSNTFMNPVNGVLASHEAIGVPPYIPPGSHAYFPPYGMPVMNQAVSGSAVEQANQLQVEGSHVQNGHSSANGTNISIHNQSSSNMPVQRNGSMSHVRKPQASEESELRGSSASSPGEMAEGTKTRQIAEGGRDAHSSCLKAPVVLDGTRQSLESRLQTRVIKVVPHNARSATESAARIFRSIQEERKRYDV